MVRDVPAIRGDQPKDTIIMLQLIAPIDQRQEERGKIREAGDLLAILGQSSFEPGKRAQGDLARLRQHDQHLLALLCGKRFADAARDHPGRVDALAAQQFDDLLPNRPQPDAVSRHFRMLRQHAEEIAPGRLGIHTQQ